MADLTKEQQPIGTERVTVQPEVPTVESPRKAEVQPEVESWITKIEKRFARVPKGAPGPQDDQVVVQQPQSTQPPVTLPVTHQDMQQGQNASITLSIKWLVTWAKRQIQIFTRRGRTVKMQDIPEVKE